MIYQLQPITFTGVIRCKKCLHRGTDECPMYFIESFYNEDDGWDEIPYDRTEDDGFCHRGFTAIDF